MSSVGKVGKTLLNATSNVTEPHLIESNSLERFLCYENMTQQKHMACASLCVASQTEWTIAVAFKE